MTLPRDDQPVEPAADAGSSDAPSVAQPLSRRALLRGAAVAAPTIVTMSSASAVVAMSSVRTYTSIDAPQGDGNYYCLAEKSTLGPSQNGHPDALDVGEFQQPMIARIPERDYRREPGESGARVSEVDMCRDSAFKGTRYYYPSNQGWRGVKVRRGILMSATAMSSLAVAAHPVDDV
jgi:hypothetical protein